MPRSLLGLLQAVVIAKILIYFAGLENARRHWMRVIAYAVVISGIVWWFQWCFGEAVASFFESAQYVVDLREAPGFLIRVAG